MFYIQADNYYPNLNDSFEYNSSISTESILFDKRIDFTYNYGSGIFERTYKLDSANRLTELVIPQYGSLKLSYNTKNLTYPSFEGFELA